ncbi:hypothetical protein M514_08861 [Trichuris suis]|uniref:Uncharacterized protein n=1 Tax=Trichuris suis TaxID=68888 RepID=A0A085MSW7_9BILA|nr:hypothetical protein M513_08861 [Trichuris suis]KFD60313.1 hypothetical protein M514_08861 [Trichuris suis]
MDLMSPGSPGASTTKARGTHSSGPSEAHAGELAMPLLYPWRTGRLRPCCPSYRGTSGLALILSSSRGGSDWQPPTTRSMPSSRASYRCSCPDQTHRLRPFQYHSERWTIHTVRSDKVRLSTEDRPGAIDNIRCGCGANYIGETGHYVAMVYINTGPRSMHTEQLKSGVELRL